MSSGIILRAVCSGFKVLEFAVGFGPKLIKWERIRASSIPVRAIPLGGFAPLPGRIRTTRDGTGRHEQYAQMV